MIGNQRNHPLTNRMDWWCWLQIFSISAKVSQPSQPSQPPKINTLELNHGRDFRKCWCLTFVALFINIRSFFRQRYVVQHGETSRKGSGKLLPDAIKCIPMFFNPVAKHGFFLLPTSIGAEFFEASTVSQIKGNCKCHCGESSFQISPKKAIRDHNQSHRQKDSIDQKLISTPIAWQEPWNQVVHSLSRAWSLRLKPLKINGLKINFAFGNVT